MARLCALRSLPLKPREALRTLGKAAGASLGATAISPWKTRVCTHLHVPRRVKHRMKGAKENWPTKPFSERISFLE